MFGLLSLTKNYFKNFLPRQAKIEQTTYLLFLHSFQYSPLQLTIQNVTRYND